MAWYIEKIMDNRDLFGDYGACEAILNILHLYGRTNHFVAERGLAAIKNLSAGNTANKKRLGDFGMQMILRTELHSKDYCILYSF